MKFNQFKREGCKSRERQSEELQRVTHLNFQTQTSLRLGIATVHGTWYVYLTSFSLFFNVDVPQSGAVDI